MQSSLGENATSNVMLKCQEKTERQNLVQTKLNDRYILCQQEQTSLSSQVNRCLKQTNEKKEERRSHNRSLLNPKTCFGRLYMLQLQYWSSFGGRGGVGTAIYGLLQVYATVKGSLLWDRVYESESLGLKQGIVLHETDQLVEDYSLYYGNRELPLKNIKKSNRQV